MPLGPTLTHFILCICLLLAFPHNTCMLETRSSRPPISSFPQPPTDLISTPQALATLCEHLRAAGTFAFDTEFIGESTYHPILCLIQVATAERVELIDPMAITRD